MTGDILSAFVGISKKSLSFVVELIPLTLVFIMGAILDWIAFWFNRALSSLFNDVSQYQKKLLFSNYHTFRFGHIQLQFIYF